MIAQLHRYVLCLTVVMLGIWTRDIDAASPSGRWAGSWRSQTTGHNGPMRVRVRQVDSQTYRALFVGRFAKVVPFAYPAKLKRVPGSYSLYRSQQRLPLLGEYQMTARVTPGRFDAQYRSRNDYGQFNMRRR